jgi:hypothetical protein
MFGRILTALLIILAISSCIQTENTNSYDDLLYGVANGSTGFGTARFIMSQNCSSCHNYHTMSEQELIFAGVVVSGGDPTQSPIYNRLKGSEGGAGPKNMPPNSSLSPGDIADIEEWLTNVP